MDATCCHTHSIYYAICFLAECEKTPETKQYRAGDVLPKGEVRNYRQGHCTKFHALPIWGGNWSLHKDIGQGSPNKDMPTQCPSVTIPCCVALTSMNMVLAHPCLGAPNLE